MAFLTKEEMLAKIHLDERVFPIGSIITIPPPRNGNVYQETGTGEKFLIRSNAPCTYCGGNQREEDNKSCYSCGSVDFKDTTVTIPMALPRIKTERTFFDDINDLNRALFEFDPFGFLVNSVKIYINTAKRLFGVKIFA